MLPSADTTFDYGTLSAEKAASARAAAERIRGRMQLAAESIIEVGRELIEQKRQLGHGNFLPWIEAEFAMSDTTSANYMKVATEFGSNSPRVGNLSFRALTALAYSPEPVRTEVLERAASGEKVTAKEIEALKAKLKKAEDAAADGASLAAMRDTRAREAEDQRDAAQTEVMYLKSDKTRLAEELEQARDELARLNDDGTIHIIREPALPSALVKIPTLLMQAFDIASDDDILELLIEREARIQALSRAAA